MSVNVGDSLSVTSMATCRFQCPPAPLGFSNHHDSAPGKPRIRMSAQPSPLTSWLWAKKLSEYSFSLPSPPL